MRNKPNVPEPTYMLYKHPGEKFIHGDYFSTKIVKESELKYSLDGEWFLTSTEAKEGLSSAGENLDENKVETNLDTEQSHATDVESETTESEITESELPEALDGELSPNETIMVGDTITVDIGDGEIIQGIAENDIEIKPKKNKGGRPKKIAK